MTSTVYADDSCPELWRQNLSLQGTTISIDFCIGTLNYLGKGLAAPTLEAFVKFFNETVDPKADTFFIDPNKDNLRATHVYEKAGFKLIGSFAAEQGFFIGKESFLMIKKL
ncbi:MAG: acetyltransferase [uncultured bacterium]|nr:MAG: acetyltransferase [uncultured bacterium]